MKVIDMDTTYRQIEHWIDDVVIGLNLCPFAARPRKMKLIDIIISDADHHEQLLFDIHAEMKRLMETPAYALETTLIATPHLLADFEEYRLFLDLVEQLLIQSGYEGELQVASFHPNYQFDGTQPDDRENFTNRSPVPIFHLLRELSITEALNKYPEPERIPSRNIERMNALPEAQLKTLFHYLWSDH